MSRRARGSYSRVSASPIWCLVIWMRFGKCLLGVATPCCRAKPQLWITLTDHALEGGRPLADGWRGALCQCRGDWDFYFQIFKFLQWNGALSMCWMRRASSTIERLAWTRCGDDAGWRETRTITNLIWSIYASRASSFLSCSSLSSVFALSASWWTCCTP